MRLPQLWILLLALTCLFWGCRGRSMTGKECPPISPVYLNHVDDSPPKLAGTVHIIEFWATWCPPCRQSIPHLNKIWDKYHEQGLEIIGISQEQPKEIEDFFEKTKMSYRVANDPDGSLHDTFNIRGIPRAFLVGKDGKIIWEGHPMELQESQIEEALKGK